MHAGNIGTIRSTTVIWIVAAFLLLILGGLLIAELTPLIIPPQASAEAQQVDALFKFMLAIGGSIFLLVQGVLLYAIINFRRKGDDHGDGAPIHGNATLEFVWTLIPTLIVLAITVYSYQVWVDNTAVKPNEQTIQVVGQRFAWTFSYDVTVNDLPEDVLVSDLEQNIQNSLDQQTLRVNSNELHTFVGQPLRMEMVTMDSQHAFWIPAMRVKQDLLPGRTTEVRFTPIEPGRFRVVCAELCGSGHGDMYGWIIVHPDEATYLSWFDDEVNRVIFPPEDPVERGRQVLASGAYPCAGCHILDDLGWQGVTGPNLNGIGDRAATVRAAATGESPEEYLDRSIYFPADYLVPGFGNLMPQFQPNDPAAPNYMPVDDHIAIVAYLCTQTATGESACDLDNLFAIAEQYR